MVLKEINGDLFDMPNDYALAHCISADFALGAGIAKEFNKRFGTRDDLFFTTCGHNMVDTWDDETRETHGNCIITKYKDTDPFVINLITKRNYWNKPTLKTIEEALDNMKFCCFLYGISKIAMPRIGCGLDKQKWSDIKPLIEKVFGDTDFEIVICVKG